MINKTLSEFNSLVDPYYYLSCLKFIKVCLETNNTIIFLLKNDLFKKLTESVIQRILLFRIHNIKKFDLDIDQEIILIVSLVVNNFMKLEIELNKEIPKLIRKYKETISTSIMI